MQFNKGVLMVASGKGGTGKSTFSVLLGGRLAAQGHSVLLIELDSGLRSVDIISGVYGKTVYDIEDVLCGRCDGNKAVVESPLYPGLHVISAPYENGIVRPQELSRLVEGMKEHFDYILLDTAAGVGLPFEAASSVSDMALLVLTPDPVTLRDGHIVSEMLLEKGVPEVRLVINRLSRQSFRARGVRDLDECIDTVGVQLMGVVPESSEIMDAAAGGTALKTDCLAFDALESIAFRLQGERVPLAIPPTGV